MTLYKKSDGTLIEVSSMALPYAKNALNKLRTDENRHRTTEIAAIEMHIADLELNPPAMGHNGAPEDDAPAKPMQWEALKPHMDDLEMEARNWADGEPITSQAQADEVATLRNRINDAIKLADEARIEEKKPLDEKAKAIQDRFNTYIAPSKNKTPGKLTKAKDALGNLLTPWLVKLDEEKRERERAAQVAADEAATKALEASTQARQSFDLSAIDEAEALLTAAEDAKREAAAVSKEKVQAKGEGRAQSLRTTWHATLREGEGNKALVHYAKTQSQRVMAFLQQMADEDVRAGIREIPGFDVVAKKSV